MALLVDLMRAEDPAYAEAAAARTRTSHARTSRPRRALVGGLVLAVIGVATGTAAAAVRDAADDGAGRAGLEREVLRRTTESDALARQEAALRDDVATRRATALGGGAEAQRLAQLELAAATVAVTGPGVLVTLDDRPAGEAVTPALPRGGQVGSGRVLDRDLQQAVNGLWAAGAEAVTVNDLRLTARTAIRSAGEAVLVDYRPLSPPYLVRAVGAPARLEPTFADGAAGRQLATYAGLYGLRFTVEQRDDLRLPAGSVPEPRAAVPSAPP